MVHEFERKLAVEMIATKLKKECARDPLVKGCLMEVLHVAVDLATAMTHCIAELCEQKNKLADEVCRLSDLVATPLIHESR